MYSNVGLPCAYYDSNGDFISAQNDPSMTYFKIRSYTTPENCSYIVFNIVTDKWDEYYLEI